MANTFTITAATRLQELLEDVAEFLEGQMDADGGPDGYTPNKAMSLYTEVEQEIQRLKNAAPQAVSRGHTLAGESSDSGPAVAAQCGPDSEAYGVISDALVYINHVGSNWTMRGEPHPQQWLVDRLEGYLKRHDVPPQGGVPPNSELLIALVMAREALYNGFEPDNQSRAWHNVDAVIKRHAATSQPASGVSKPLEPR